jgi:RNA polymerase sigma-70 factor (ECF subfamily)
MSSTPFTLRIADGGAYVRAMDTGADRASSVIEAVVARFRRMVRSVGVRRGLVDADLDEVLQDVRIRLWQAGERGKPIEELGASFLYQVATSAALDVLRRRRSRRAEQSVAIDAEATEQREQTAPGPSPHEDVERSELQAQIDAAVESLAIDRRVAVRMHLAGYDRDDIARALGWSEARTRNLVYRGLEDVRRRLAAVGITRARLAPRAGEA